MGEFRTFFQETGGGTDGRASDAISKIYRLIYKGPDSRYLVSLDVAIERRIAGSGSRAWRLLNPVELDRVAIAGGEATLTFLEKYPRVQDDREVALSCAVFCFSECLFSFLYWERMEEYRALARRFDSSSDSQDVSSSLEEVFNDSRFEILKIRDGLNNSEIHEQWLGELHRDMKVGMTLFLKDSPFAGVWTEDYPYLKVWTSEDSWREVLATRVTNLCEAIEALWADRQNRRFPARKGGVRECLERLDEATNVPSRAQDFRKQIRDDLGQ